MFAPDSLSACAGIDGRVQVLIVFSDAIDSSGLSDIENQEPSGAPK